MGTHNSTSDFTVHHVQVAVADTPAWRRHLLRWGFTADELSPAGGLAPHRVLLRQGRIRLLVSQLDVTSTGMALGGTTEYDYLRRHDDGVRDIVLRTHNFAAAERRARAAGATILREPATLGSTTSMVIASPCGDLVHTIVAHPDTPRPHVPYIGPMWMEETPAPLGLRDIDHVALVCHREGPGGLDEVAEFYTSALGFQHLYAQDIDGPSGMRSVALTTGDGAGSGVTVTLVAPITDRGGQLHRFLERHRGPGVQHTALATDDIVASVTALRTMGVPFAEATPATYYDELAGRLPPRGRHGVAALRRAGIVADTPATGGPLYQIFARPLGTPPAGTPTHPRDGVSGSIGGRGVRTCHFIELIERGRDANGVPASGFGENNVQRLVDAEDHAETEDTRVADRGGR